MKTITSSLSKHNPAINITKPGSCSRFVNPFKKSFRQDHANVTYAAHAKSSSLSPGMSPLRLHSFDSRGVSAIFPGETPPEFIPPMPSDSRDPTPPPEVVPTDPSPLFDSVVPQEVPTDPLPGSPGPNPGLEMPWPPFPVPDPPLPPKPEVPPPLNPDIVPPSPPEILPPPATPPPDIVPLPTVPPEITPPEDPFGGIVFGILLR